VQGSLRPALVALGVAALLLAGCSTIDSRIRDNQALFDDYAPEVQQKIRAGEIAVGFTPEMVVMAWGEPYRKDQVTGEDFAAEVWTWSRNVPGIGIGMGTGGYYGGNVGIGSGVVIGEGSRREDRSQVEFRNGKVVTFRNLKDE
jgi:uncharacterized protein YceK